MIKVKMCGLKRAEEIKSANIVRPDYIGFVFAKKSRRYVSPEKAARLRSELDKDIKAVGVFVDADIFSVTELLKSGTIDIAQLHGSENNEYIAELKKQTDKPVIKAFRIKTEYDISEAQNSPADMILLDGGAGDGKTFDWTLLQELKRPYFLAGGLDKKNIEKIMKDPFLFALDVSSGIETNGYKDIKKMSAFMDAVRKDDRND